MVAPRIKPGSSERAGAHANRGSDERTPIEAASSNRSPERLDRAARQIALLEETLQELPRWQELDLLLSLVVERARELVGALSSSLYLLDAGQEELVLHAARPAARDLSRRVRVGEQIVGQAAELRTFIAVEEPPGGRRHPSLAGASVILAVPMLYGGELVGVLRVDHPRMTARSRPQDLQFLSVLSSAAAGAVRNIRLLEDLRMRRQQLASLYDAALAVNSPTDARGQLEFLLTIALRTFHAEHADLWRVKPDGRQVVLQASADQRLASTKVEWARLQTGQRNIFTWVIQNRAPLRIPDLQEDPRANGVTVDERCALYSPIEHNHELYGIVAVVSKRPGIWSQDDERLLALFANLIALPLYALHSLEK